MEDFSDEQVETVKRPSWCINFLFPACNHWSYQGKWCRRHTVSELPNLVPALITYPKQVYFPTPEIAVDPEGVYEHPWVYQALTYTVISEVPTVIAASCNKPQPTIPPELYLQVPRKLPQKCGNTRKKS